jgi:hypothetical protein
MSIIDALIGGIDSALDTLFAPLSSREEDTNPQQHASWLASVATYANDGEMNADGSITIGTVVLPRIVADQLKKLGGSLAFFNAGQLQAAIDGCAIDCNLIDDAHGDNFLDGLTLDDSEIDKDEEDSEISEDLFRRNFLSAGRGNVFAEPSEATGSVFYDPQFRDRIKAEREQQRERRKRGTSKDDETTEAPALQQIGH